MKHAITLTLALVVVGCVQQTDVPAAETPTEHKAAWQVGTGNATYDTYVYQITDQEHGVICYVSDGYKSGGISCLKLSQ